MFEVEYSDGRKATIKGGVADGGIATTWTPRYGPQIPYQKMGLPYPTPRVIGGVATFEVIDPMPGTDGAMWIMTETTEPMT